MQRGDSYLYSGSRLMGLPARLRFGAGLFQMDAFVDVIDPCKRNEVMLTAGIRVVLRQLDLIGALHAVRGADAHAVRTEDFHMFLDRHRCDHVSPPLL